MEDIPKEVGYTWAPFTIKDWVEKYGGYDDDDECIRSQLGRGTFAITCRMKNTEGELVAAKIINRRDVKNQGMSEDQLEREVRVFKRLSHKHVVKYIDCLRTRKYFVLVMELASGGSLDNVVKQRPVVAVDRVIQLAHQIASAVEYIHGEGVVHRDLKPSNILLTDKGVSKLADFGMATMLQSTAASALMSKGGTPAYLSPERAKGQEYGRPADMWAVGCILLNLIHGELNIGPLWDDSEEVVIKRQSLIEQAKERSKEIADVVQKLLVSDPVERMSAVDVKMGLHSVLRRNSSIIHYDCPNMQFCRQFLDSLGPPSVSPSYLDPIHDRCYCPNCTQKSNVHENLKVDVQGGHRYEVPLGWCGFGLKLSPRAEALGIFGWPVSFHGCPSTVITSILNEGSLLMPGDTLLDGTKLQNRCTMGGEQQIQLYTSPSILYSELDIYSSPCEYAGSTVRVVLQCRQQPGFSVRGETIGWERRFGPVAISPYFENAEIERYTRSRASIFPYRILIKVNSVTREHEEERRKQGGASSKSFNASQEDVSRLNSSSRQGDDPLSQLGNGDNNGAMSAPVNTEFEPSEIAECKKLPQSDRDHALYAAAMEGNDRKARLLIAAKASVHGYKDEYGDSCLSEAAREGHVTVVRVLVDGGADLHARSYYGNTCLMWAARNGHLRVVEFLVAAKADVEAKNDNGKTALAFAIKGKHSKVVEYLKGQGVSEGCACCIL